MKKQFFLSFILLNVFIANAQKKSGIDFRTDKKWSEILDLAKTENKLIFVDVYTDWCGPCKEMDKEVFPLKAVGDKYNTSFINYKIDAEKGEGKLLRKRYNVQVYPNYLFVNGDGVLIYRSTSAVPERQFIALANTALEEAKQPQTIAYLDSLYLSNKRDIGFMFTYLNRRTKLMLDNRQLLNDYVSLLTKTEASSIKNLQLILDNGLNDNLIIGASLNVLIANQDKYSSLKQKYKVTLQDIIELARESTLNLAIKTKDEQLLMKLLVETPTFDQDPLQNKNTFLITYYERTKQKTKHYKEVTSLMDNVTIYPQKSLKEKDDSFYKSYMNEVQGNAKKDEEIFAKQRYSFNYIKNNIYVLSGLLTDVRSQKELNQIASWLQFIKSLTKNDNGTNYKPLLELFDYNETVLLYKLNKKQEAILKLEEVLLKYDGRNHKEYQKTLVRMKNNEII